jgi:NAD+ synthase (glutamine-hydrolysing)
MAEEHGVFVVLANLVGSEAGKLFPGASMVAGPMGDVRARGPLWEEALVTVTLDLRDVTHARADMPLVADLETMLPHLQESLALVARREAHSVEFDEGVGGGAWGVGRRVEPRSEGSAISDQRSATTPNASHPTPLFPVHGSDGNRAASPHPLEIDPILTEQWLVHFIREEMERRGFERAVVGVSGGVDSAVTVALAARALGAKNVHGIRMPYRTSSADSLAHAQLLIESLGINCRTVDISDAVDGYLRHEPDAEAGRRGNVMARMRMITLFDLSAKYRAIPLGTGNKTERLFGYFTWHADDSPPINPLGDLFKTQVWALAKHLGIPDVIVTKPPSADLVVDQTDEGDFGISYAKADEILNWMLSGYDIDQLVERGFDRGDVELVRKRLQSTHWKRRLPTVALMSPTAIGESYLRPVDY